MSDIVIPTYREHEIAADLMSGDWQTVVRYVREAERAKAAHKLVPISDELEREDSAAAEILR